MVSGHPIEQWLDPERARDQATSVLVSISRQWMTPMAQQLGLEHSSTGVRIDLGRLTVVAGTPQGAVYMDTGIGPAKNWVGYHLASVLSLQQHFVEENRPVPSFLILDQPTQAFFPSDQATEQRRIRIGAMCSLNSNSCATSLSGSRITCKSLFLLTMPTSPRLGSARPSSNAGAMATP